MVADDGGVGFLAPVKQLQSRRSRCKGNNQLKGREQRLWTASTLVDHLAHFDLLPFSSLHRLLARHFIFTLMAQIQATR